MVRGRRVSGKGQLQRSQWMTRGWNGWRTWDSTYPQVNRCSGGRRGARSGIEICHDERKEGRHLGTTGRRTCPRNHSLVVRWSWGSCGCRDVAVGVPGQDVLEELLQGSLHLLDVLTDRDQVNLVVEVFCGRFVKVQFLKRSSCISREFNLLGINTVSDCVVARFRMLLS